MNPVKLCIEKGAPDGFISKEHVVFSLVFLSCVFLILNINRIMINIKIVMISSYFKLRKRISLF